MLTLASQLTRLLNVDLAFSSQSLGLPSPHSFKEVNDGSGVAFLNQGPQNCHNYFLNIQIRIKRRSSIKPHQFQLAHHLRTVTQRL